jgi:hypothetical protein
VLPSVRATTSIVASSRAARIVPVADGEIQTSLQVGGIARRRIRRSASGSVTVEPLGIR